LYFLKCIKTLLSPQNKEEFKKNAFDAFWGLRPCGSFLRPGNLHARKISVFEKKFLQYDVTAEGFHRLL